MTARFRAAVLEMYGSWCVAIGPSEGPCEGPIAAHHIVYRSQGGPNVAENGIPLCRRHHDRVHAGEVRIPPDWLTWDALDWLDEQGHVAWTTSGQPYGLHWRSFAPRR